MEASSRHQSVTELELAFAQNPESTAYVDLCIAYIEQSRFMEAMVVCKKGLKAHPDSIEAHVLLSRVYGAQKKYKKALQELDELQQAKPEAGEVYLARGKMRLESGDEPGAIDDLKKALDKDAKLEEASKILKDKGIVYPEPKATPPPPPPPVPQAVMPARSISQPMVIGLPPGAARPVSSIVPRSTSVGHPIDAAFAAVPPEGQVVQSGTPMPMPRAISAPIAAQYVVIPPTMPGSGPQVVLQYQPRLEGEEELEELAKEIADKKEDRGRPKTTATFLVFILVLFFGAAGYWFWRKSRIERIDQLTTEATNAFSQDTYGSYKTAAGFFKDILKVESNHPLTLGRLAQTDVILWGEHGERDPEMDEILDRAEKKAGDVSHTVAAHALRVLYDGKDRQGNAAKAHDILQPFLERERTEQAAPSYADLTAAIVDLELGNYESATEVLGNVKQVLPGSVRAKVWHARAAYRAGRFGTAEAAFSEALRAKPGHPGARAGLALVKVVRGDLNGAAEQLLKFDELPPKDISNRDRALAEFARSQVFRAAGDDSKALGAYELAVRFDPENADFPYGLGRFYLDNENERAALPYLKKAVEMERARVVFLLSLAEAEMRPGVNDNKSAQDHIEQALRRAPNSVDAAMAKARLLRRTNNPETESYLKKTLAQWPSAEAEIDLELGRLYKSQSKLDEAKQMLEKSVDKMGGLSATKQGDIVLSYAKLEEARNELDIAAKSYKQAGEFGNMQGWYEFARMMARGGKEERVEAKKACERYLAAGASLPKADEARAMCSQLR
jgi:tetratricopeptide (TPR) repeat protein